MTVGPKPGQSMRDYTDTRVAKLTSYKKKTAAQRAGQGVAVANERRRVLGLAPDRSYESRGFTKTKRGYVSTSLSPKRKAQAIQRQEDFYTRVILPGQISGQRAIPLSKPNWLTGQMYASKWQLEPIKTYNGNEIYFDKVANVYHIKGTKGQVAHYSWSHKRLQIKVDAKQETEYPNWFDAETINYIESMGGLTSNPHYTRR